MQRRWGWQALRLFMEVGFVDETVFGALQEAVRSHQEQDASADPEEAAQRAAAAQHAKRLREGVGLGCQERGPVRHSEYFSGGTDICLGYDAPGC